MAVELIDLLAVHVILVAGHSEEVVIYPRAHRLAVDGFGADSCLFVGILHNILIQTVLKLLCSTVCLCAFLHQLDKSHRGDDLSYDYHDQHC